ncbi:hypothetical protein BA768_02410 [Chryseobacterium sp. CBo1]|uniref:hypothetical protein n=1 Tax=Chryseobacterium sp. CBo1 TaxID=1869230 RepID=UPI0008105C1B|nr:hypothetical protein [Chryseobacterium sp. CBo1]OCK53411.1 hypothetical protein BA768_02410 [Chryseobacterium sp. CBo1]
MKRILLPLATVLITGFSMTSCTIEVNDGIEEAPTIISGDETLKGIISKDVVFKKGNYTLDGIVKVTNGAKITIEAGAVFNVVTTKTSALVILNDGLIDAQGTATEPIVFTTSTKTPGDWGGITIYGEAPIKALNGNTTAVSEDGNALTYGGTNPNDNSGIMKFVRVEYAGKKIGDGTSETNTFTFYSVGAGTVLENLVAYKGTDDGFEWFGGTVSAKNLVSYGNFDDSFDWQDAWSGQNNSNWFAYQVGTGNFGMEIEASSNADNVAPKVNNLTLIRAAGTNPEAANSPEITAIQFKKQGSGIFSNVYISGYKNIGAQKAYSVLIQDSATETGQVNTGKIVVSPMTYLDSDNPLVWGYAFTPNGGKTFTNATTVTKVSLPTGAWATVDGVNLLSAL